jgi:hypothetical protein
MIRTTDGAIMIFPRIRKRGPEGAKRPFEPTMNGMEQWEIGEKVAEALEHIAIALSAIDHNLEVLVDHLTRTKPASPGPPQRTGRP